MKIILVALLFVGIISAADPTFKYAGTTKGGATFNSPSLDSSNVCTAGSSASPYVNFTVAFSTSGVREIAAMAERDYKSSIQLFIYSTFNPSAPCQNLLFILTDSQYGSGLGGPVVDNFPYFDAGSYVVVVSGGEVGGLFAVNIFPSDAAGQIGSANGNWTVPLTQSGSCSTTSYTALYGTYTFTQSTTGYFDLYALLYNSTSTSSISSAIALFQGIPSATGLSSDVCNNTATNATFVEANAGSYGGVYLPYVSLTAGTVYTLVFSTNDISQTVYYGVQVIPTRIRFQQPSGWTQPSRSLTDGCTASSYEDVSWDATVFQTEQRAYLIDTGRPPAPFDYFDTYSFLYEGYNTGNSLVSPFTCPIYAPLVNFGDTGDITPVFAIVNPGENYTVIVSTYSGINATRNENYNYAYVLYLFTGTPIGSLPPATTGGGATTTSTGAQTTAQTTTGGQTTAAQTTAAQTTAQTTAAQTTAQTTAAQTTTARTTTAQTTAQTSAGSTTAKTTSAATTGTGSTTGSASSSSKVTTSTTSGAAPQNMVVAPVAIVFLVLAAVFVF